MKYGRAIGLGFAGGLVVVLAVLVAGCAPRPLEAYCFTYGSYPCSGGFYRFHGGTY